MRNSNLVFGLLIFLLVRSSSFQTADSDESNDGYTSDSETVQWQLLTKINYSDEIRRHPHILLLVTVPWSGESKSLMKQISRVVANDKARFGSLKLMLLYKSSERMLANTLGATDEITIIYFHHTMSYKYGGKLQVQTILSSMSYVMPLPPEEFPITPLNTEDELKGFLNSTDKAVLLLEFCGWAPRLLAEERNNMTGHAFGDIAKTNGSLLLEEEARKQKVMNYNQMTCSIGTGVMPWLTDFSLGNETVMPDDATLTPESSSVCKINDLQRLVYFLPKFINFATEFFLPPERIRFGLVSERSFLRELNIEASGSWLITLHVAGCPSCSKVLKENDDLKLVLQTQGSEVTELENEVHDLQPALPANKPSVLLFIDRSSNLLNVRKHSMIALDAFRELALDRQLSDSKNEQNKGQIREQSHKTDQSSRNSKHPKLALSPVNQNMFIKEKKTSLVIMNDGKQISLDNFLPDLQGSSLQEILEHLLHQNKEPKLSKVAKDAGFQLLSEDFVIKDTESSSSQQESHPDHVLELPSVDVSETTLDLDNNQKIQREQSSQDKKSEEDMLTGTDKKKHRNDFNGSFFFCDGNFRLLKSLTSTSKIPSMVIIDPIKQQHFILPEPSASFSHSLLSDFLDEFLNGSLTPYEQSESLIQIHRETPTPPFVNLDFHEVDSIPKVAVNTFTEQVFGKQPNSGNKNDAWSKDVLVLFSNNWCGFCQRMELAVREVYKAINGYSNTLKNESVSTTIYNNMKNSSFPLVYLMDCTLNDCRQILTSAVKREVYPHLVLFPAGKKIPIPYEGDFSVSQIINFLADRGALALDEGIQLAGVDEGGNISKSANVSQITYSLTTNSYKTNPKVMPGSILSATDKLLDAHTFSESKILIVKADQGTGFEGLIVNKHLNWNTIQHLKEDGLELLKNAPLSYGGPVIKRGMPLVALSNHHHPVKDQDDPEILLPGIYYIDQLETLKLIEEVKLRSKSVHDYWFFLGFSNWGWNQLFQEIAQGDWDVWEGNNNEQFDWPKVK